MRCPFRAHARYFDPQACGLGYDENGPLGLSCTEPRNETLVHGLPRAVRDGRDPPFSNEMALALPFGDPVADAASAARVAREDAAFKQIPNIAQGSI